MDRENIQNLLARVNSGVATDSEREQLEELLKAGLVDIGEVEGLAELEDRLMQMKTPSPSSALDRRFYQMLSGERKNKRRISWWPSLSWDGFAPRLAIASVTLILGLLGGYLLAPHSSSDDQIQRLSLQVSELQEMMMLSLLEKGTATERLKAVSLSQEMPEVSRKVTTALIQTLNQDENVNVRLAALEALKPYAADSMVREALIRSIAKQESPLVQISLAELMVALQEKSAVSEFEKLMNSDETPAEIKKKIRESINVLI